MKRVCLLLAVMAAIVAAVPAARAQRVYEPKFYVGVKGGATLSTVQFNPHVRQKLNQGILGGIQLRYTEEKIFGIIGELLLEQRGWKERFEPGENFSYSRRLTYVSLPVLTHIYFGSDRIKGFVNLGPSISILLSNSITSDFDYMDPASVPGFPMSYRSVEQMGMEVKKKFDYGLVGGLGMELTVARRHSLLLEGRYYFGLGNVFPAAKRDVFAASRNQTISVALSYLFRVK